MSRIRLWVATLDISPRTAAKIVQRHGITEDEVRQAVVGVRRLAAVWDDDPERGLRAIVETQIRGRPVLLVLYERPDPLGDAFNLGSAYFTDGI